MTLTKEAKQELIEKHGQDEHGHRLARGADRDADAADQRADRAPAHAPARITTRGAACSSSSAAGGGSSNYLQRKDLEGYRALIKELGLRR